MELHLGDCLQVLPHLSKVDLVLADIPYGKTQCKWDSILPLDEMWKALDYVRSNNTAIVLFGCEPFSSALRMSNIKEFKYDWIWDKPKGTGFLNARKQPMRNHEIISVFYRKQCNYYPQKTANHRVRESFRSKQMQTDVYGDMKNDYKYKSTTRYPRSVQTFSTDTQNSSLHPTQKPVELMEYLIKTYTTEGQVVLDFTMGSGTTGIAALNAKREFIGIESNIEYFRKAENRINAHKAALASIKE